MYELPNKNFRRKRSMVEGERRNWRELCNAALQARNADELMNILQELSMVLKREEQVRRDFRNAMREDHSAGKHRTIETLAS